MGGLANKNNRSWELFAHTAAMETIYKHTQRGNRNPPIQKEKKNQPNNNIQKQTKYTEHLGQI